MVGPHRYGADDFWLCRIVMAFTDASSIVNSAAILLPCSLYRSALGTSTQLLLVLLSDVIDYGRMAGGLHDH